LNKQRLASKTSNITEEIYLEPVIQGVQDLTIQRSNILSQHEAIGIQADSGI